MIGGAMAADLANYYNDTVVPSYMNVTFCVDTCKYRYF
jgi:hypothetical protein